MSDHLRPTSPRPSSPMQFHPVQDTQYCHEPGASEDSPWAGEVPEPKSLGPVAVPFAAPFQLRSPISLTSEPRFVSDMFSVRTQPVFGTNRWNLGEHASDIPACRGRARHNLQDHSRGINSITPSPMEFNDAQVPNVGYAPFHVRFSQHSLRQPITPQPHNRSQANIPNTTNLVPGAAINHPDDMSDVLEKGDCGEPSSASAPSSSTPSCSCNQHSHENPEALLLLETLHILATATHAALLSRLPPGLAIKPSFTRKRASNGHKNQTQGNESE